MDNFQRLFNEVRPQRSGGMQVVKLDDLKGMLEAEWLKNLLKAVSAYGMKDYDLAISFIDKAISENKDHQHLYKVRANIKEEVGDAEGAILDYKMSLYISGEDWYATYNQIAINYLNKKEFQRALIAFDIAIEAKRSLQSEDIDEDLLPNAHHGVVMRVAFERMYTNRANVKLSLKDFQGCADDCAVAIDINPEYSNSYFIYALLFLTVNQNENAYNAFKIAESKGHKLATAALKQYFQ